jgi:O-acetyl-ADP-ribose deacetylase (regulator of RNase III)
LITYLKSNLFFSPAQVLVNTVNTEGVMGKGIAKEFKKLFPDMFKNYQTLCESKKLQVGNLWIYKTPNKWVLNFPTKKSWRQPSKIEYIEAGLKKFVDNYSSKGIQSVAFPPLGCGNGELNWENDVKPLMEKYLKSLPIDVYIHLYTPNDLEDVPEHKHIKNVSDWLQKEPLLLSFNEILENLKKTLFLMNCEDLGGFQVEFTEDALKIMGKDISEEWLFEDLSDVWAILRKHGVLNIENAPSRFIDCYELLINVFSKLPYIAKIDATFHYKNLSKVNHALQLLPLQKDSYDKTVAI